jgi:uncharacterized lipoprotein YmbA
MSFIPGICIRLRNKSTAFVAVVVVMLTACSAPKPLPDFRYYRLPEAAVAPQSVSAPLTLPIMIETLRADGVRGERPMLYANSDDSLKLLQYHYQLWVDPPGSLIQSRLIERLEQARLAPLVTARLSPRGEHIRVTGQILRFERVNQGNGWQTVVSLRLRAETNQAALPLFERTFTRTQEVQDGLNATATAFAQDIDAIADELVQALLEQARS